jgi:hypothetical protein
MPRPSKQRPLPRSLATATRDLAASAAIGAVAPTGSSSRFNRRRVQGQATCTALGSGGPVFRATRNAIAIGKQTRGQHDRMFDVNRTAC